VKEILKEVRRFLKEETSSIDTFDGAKPRFLNRGKKRRFLRQAQDTEFYRSAVSTLSIPRASDRGVEWVDHLSLSGSGEPTLHSKIGSVIEGIKAITSIPVAVITNGSLLYEEEVRQDLLHADIVLPSLDAVSPEVFMKVNRPRPGFSIEKVIEGVVEFRKVYKGQIWLEILFCKGVNDSQEELMRMKKAVDRIQPDRIHLNTIVRPPSEKWAAPLNRKEMEKIRDFFGEKAEIISEFDRHPPSMLERDIKEEIFKILRRRPLSLSDLSKGMGISQNELDQYIKPLAQEGKIQTRIYGGSIYYEISKES
jgi:wyosine [tRNA(Phe)-imidazoG37] synthetase (radical SAM superfamily)